jgi:transcriptional regulator with XRE-family HTH domain
MERDTPWTDPRLRAAWAQGDLRAVLREYKRAAGISQTTLAGLVGLSQADVSLLIREKRELRDAAVIRRITEGLRVPPELTNLPASTTASEWSPDPELSDRIARARARGSADVEDAHWIAVALAQHRRAEDSGSGVRVWPIIRVQLEEVTKLLPDASGEAADRLLLLAAEHAHWLSWVAHGQGHLGAAQQWLNLAAGWALDAGSADMASWCARVRAYYQLDADDPVRALRTAKAATRDGHQLSPAAASIARHTEAMAAARVGERDRARRLADQAYEDALRARDEDGRPGWLYWLSPARATLLRGEAAHAARDWVVAADALAQGISALGADYPRDAAFYSLRLADARRRA